MTRKEHLKKLPLQKRLQAMENIRKRESSFPFFEIVTDESHTDYVLCFIYDKTRQGHEYWMNINRKYFS